MAYPDLTKLNLNKPSGPSSTLEDKPNLQKRPNLRDTMLAKVTIALLKTQHPQVGYLFNCHQAPSDAEETMIRGYIKEAKELKKLLGEPIGRYTYGERSRIYAHNKHQLEVTIAYWKILLAPIRRVPPEILAHIFTFTGPWTHDRRDRCTCNGYNHRLSIVNAPPCVGAPLPLLHVCRFWRNVAESTRSLWERLPDIEMMDIDPKKAERRLALLRKCVDLGKQNFSVFIRGPEWEHGWACSRRAQGLALDSETPSHDLIDFIGQTCHLWVDCTISCPSTSAQHLKNIIGKLPRLQSVTLICPDIFDPPPDPHVDVDLFQNAPLLRSLNLMGDYNGYVNVHMPQLLYLKDHFSRDHGRSHLFENPLFANLVDLDLVDRFVPEWRHPPTTMIDFPRLEKLHMSCLQDMETGLMPRMIFPRLVSLSIVTGYCESGDLDMGDIFGVIERGLTRSGCLSLEALLIHRTGINADGQGERTPLFSLLSATPSLLHLDIVAHLEDLQSVGTQSATSQLQSCIIRPVSRVNRETAKAISQIAENLGPSAYQKSNSSGHDIDLEKVTPMRICCYTPPSRPARAYLGNIPADYYFKHPPPLRYFITPAILEDWRPLRPLFISWLSNLIKKVDSGTYQLGGSRNVYKTKPRCCESYLPQICSHTDELLSEIESLLSESVERVLASNIHFIIARLAARALDNSLAAFGQIYNSGGKFPNAWIVFRRRLLRILRGWHTTLMKEPLDNVHWVWSRTSDEVVYVPNGADIRLDKARWAATILGVPELSETRRKDMQKTLKHRLTTKK